MTGFVWVCLGAAVGAPVRYLVDEWLRTHRPGGLPIGTLAVNVVGSLLLGAVTALATGLPITEETMLVLGTGLCGALTTYSTFSLEALHLAENTTPRRATLHVGLGVTSSLLAAVSGYAIGLGALAVIAGGG